MSNVMFSPNTVTMSSREIAELTEKRHDNVKRTIETLIDRGVIQRPQIEEAEEINGLGLRQKTRVYVFSTENKRDSFVVVAQLSPEFTARIVDRWQELEAGLVPKDLPSALRAYADALEQKAIADARAEKLQITLDQHEEWASVKKIEKTHKRAFPWQPLKNYSVANEYEIKSVFDQNYGKVNAYHADVWKAVYDIELLGC